jgi:hypothetical protein
MKSKNKTTNWWQERTCAQKGSIFGLVAAILGDISILTATTPFAILLLPFYILIMVVYLLYELVFGFQGEFGALIPAMILSLIIYPLLGYLIGLIVTKIRGRNLNGKN